MVAKDPALAALVRTEQDAAKEINAGLGALNNLLSLPSDQRDSQTVAGINAEIEKLRADRKAARQQINRQFPAYADLIDPKPPTVDAIKAALVPARLCCRSTSVRMRVSCGPCRRTEISHSRQCPRPL